MDTVRAKGGSLDGVTVMVIVKEEEEGPVETSSAQLSPFLFIKQEDVKDEPAPNTSGCASPHPPDGQTPEEDPDTPDQVREEKEKKKKKGWKKGRLEEKEWSMATEGTDSLWRCRLCQRCFSSSWELTGHCCAGQGADSDGSKLEFRCPVCSDRFLRPTAFIMHRRSHVGQSRYVCGVCGRTLKTLQKLASHRRSHALGPLWHHRCQDCSRNFCSRRALRGHCERQHGGQGILEEEEEEKEKEGDEEKGRTASLSDGSGGRSAPAPGLPSPQCLRCFMTFRDVETAERHLRFKHPAEYERQLQGHTVFACCVCDRTFPSSRLLSAHQRAHSKWSLTPAGSEDSVHGNTGGGGALVDTNGDCITDRLRAEFTDTDKNSSMSCLHCNIIFTDPRTWERHMTAKHPPSPTMPPGTWTMSRSICPPSRPSRGQLRPYCCSACGERFIQESSLTKHCIEMHTS